LLLLGLATLMPGGTAWAESDRTSLGSGDGVKLKDTGENSSGLPLRHDLELPSSTPAAPLKAGWGVDAGISWAVSKESISEWLALLRQSGVRILRERDTGGHAFNPAERDYRPAYRQAKEAGFMVVAFGRETAKLPGVNKRWGLSDDLAAVFAEGRRIGRDYAAFVDVWELHNEPDLGYVPDLPERYVTHAKALYLGLKAGAREAGYDTPVIMGALGLPPSPWWERAVRNGMLDYADAYNFHYYGEPQDLTSVIEAHRQAMRVSIREKFKLKKVGRPADRHAPGASLSGKIKFKGVDRQRMLPIWITECGINAVVPGDFFNAERRAFQAHFTIETAKQALAAPDVAVFMPFILVHKGDPHAMVVAENVAPLPAWDAYAKFTRENPWPERPLFAPAGERASPVVLQWLPAEGTATHKVAGTYRVGDGGVVKGEMRVFNFGDAEVAGELGVGTPRSLSLEMKLKEAEGGLFAHETPSVAEALAGRHEIHGNQRMDGGSKLQLKLDASSCAGRVALRVPAGGSVTVPVSFTPQKAEGYFRETVTARFREKSGRSSQVVFGVERLPVETDFTAVPVAVYALERDSRVRAPQINLEGVPAGPWRLFNGVSSELIASSSPLTAPTWRFSVAKPTRDPIAPTYAVAALDGAPKGAQFLRVRLDKPMTSNAKLRVDLIDEDGQRFSIWENLGMVYGESSRDVWLALEDFHPYFWSVTVPGKLRIDPEKVREVSLRFYLQSGESMAVGLEWMGIWGLGAKAKGWR
jgi:hypothetical protein